MPPLDSFRSRAALRVGSRSVDVYRLDALEDAGVGHISRLPFSLKILLENLLRHEDGRTRHEGRRRGARCLGPGDAVRPRDRVPAGARAAAGLHRRAVRRRPGGDARRDQGAGRRPAPHQPAAAGRPGHRPLGAGRPASARAGAFAPTRSSSSSATASATRSCAGGRRRSTTSASCRRTPASSTR